MICARECARESTAKEIGLSQVAGSTRRAHRSESYEKRHSTKGPGSRACICHPSLECHPSRRYNMVCIRFAIKLWAPTDRRGTRVFCLACWRFGESSQPRMPQDRRIGHDRCPPGSLRQSSDVWRRKGAKPAAHVLRTARRRRQSHLHQSVLPNIQKPVFLRRVDLTHLVQMKVVFTCGPHSFGMIRININNSKNRQTFFE